MHETTTWVDALCMRQRLGWMQLLLLSVNFCLYILIESERDSAAGSHHSPGHL